MSAPALTVIVPTYNRSGYVRDCLTALKQSGVPDLEVIVADDGSTDDTREVVAATDPRAKYLWQQNSGTPATARNAAFKISTGRYVGFLDCDDEWLPGAAARAVEFLDRNPETDALFAEARMGNPQEGYVSWIESAGQEAFFKLPHNEPEPGFRVLEREPFFRRMAVRNPVFIGATIFRREAFESVGRFEPTLCGAADWELWLRMAHRFTWAYMAEPLAKYTRHLDNMSSNHDKMVAEFVQALRNVLVKCDLAPPDRAFIQRQLRTHLFGHAYLAYDRGDTATARKRFWRSLRAGDWRPYTLALAGLCLLPGPLARRARGAKQTVGGTRA
ncbi:glycosyltransferase [Gemmata sp. JC673]|uniref:Glycosyltransferase n=1 Tax=Gemmata algarum TaxID=2975278 RepID=A0ABU5F2W7_9BACT|nr:glycosyltransferase [Gemmata algarum]MDY3561488.1 glycosyltransferase [Gemmata algarum]